MKLKDWVEKGKPLNTIINEDCVKGLKEIEDNSVNLIVTSPPYSLGIKYDSCDDDLPYNDYLVWCEEWLKECYRILKDDGRIAINHYLATYRGEPRFPLMDFRSIQEKIGFNVKNLIIWDDNTISKLCAFGSFMSASAPHISSPFEGILIAYKKQWKRINKGIDTISKEEFINSVSGVWSMRPESKQLTMANFPVELPRRCINLLTYKNDLVLDPFMGSGSTACACIETNRNFLGFEISENYTKIAEYRLKDYEKNNIEDLFV